MPEIALTPGQTSFLVEPISSRSQPLVQISCTDRSGVFTPEVKRAWTAVLSHFDTLRVGFRRDAAGTFIPFVADQLTLPWHVAPAPDTSTATPESWLQFLATDRANPFELDQPPLWRITVFEVSPAELRWVWTFHHALFDGRSFEPILTAFAAAKTHQPLPPVALTATQVARALQTKRQAAHDRGLAAAHWRKYFADPPAPVNPTQPLPPSSPRGRSHHLAAIALTSGEQATLVRAARESQITTGTVVLGAWSVVLSALLDTHDIVFGVTRACRHLPAGEAKSAVGLFINTLPFRAKLNPDQSFRDLLQSLREQQISLRDAELDTMLDIRAAAPDIAPPLFSSSVVIENRDHVEAFNHRWQTTLHQEFDLTQSRPPIPLLLTGHLNPQLKLELVASADQFDAAFAHSIANAYLTVLRHSIAHPDTPLRSIPLVSPATAAGIRRQLTGPVLPVPTDELLHHRFEKSARSHPQKVAIHDDEATTTYEQLNASAERIAARLRQLGIVPDTLCAVVLPRSARLLASILGVLKSGGTNLMLDAGFPLPRLVRLIRQGQPVVVLCDAKFSAELSAAACTIPCLDPANLPPPSPPASAAPAAPAAPAPSLLPSHLAYAIFTSGSSGLPKLVGVEHRQAVNFVAHATAQVADPDALRWVPFIDSPAFDSCISQIFTTLAHSGSLVSFAQVSQLRESPFFEKFTCIGSAPNQLTTLLDSGGFPPAARLVSTGGDIIPDALITALSQQPSVQRVVNLYGPTETTVYCTAQTLFDRLASTLPFSRIKTQSGRNIGRPISNVTVEVVSPLGQTLPAGWPGELWISGALVARGYLLETAQAASPFESPPSPRRYHSGDRVVLTPDGTLQFEGRRDQQIKIRGVRIDPAEIVSRLREQAGVKDVFVGLHRAPGASPLLAAWVAGSSELDLKKIRQAVAQQLPAAAVPSLWRALDFLPLTHSGKVDHRNLPPPSPSVAEIDPQDFRPTERRLLNLWHRQLNLPPPSLTTDFFATGGDSLVAAQWIAVIETEFNLRLPVGILHQSASIKDLAQWIDRHLAALIAPTTPTSVSIISIHTTGSGIPLLIIPGGAGDDPQFVRFRPLINHLAPQRPVYWLSRSLPESVERASDPATISKYIASATAAITRQFGDKPIATLGYCLGGTTAWLINQAFEKQGHQHLKLLLLDTVLPLEFQRRSRFVKRFGLIIAYQSAWQQSYPSAFGRWLKLPLWTARILRQKLSAPSPNPPNPPPGGVVTPDPITIALGENLRRQQFEGTTRKPICLLHSDSSARSHLPSEWRKKTSGDLTYVRLSLLSHHEIVSHAPAQIAAHIARFLDPS